MEIKNGDIQKLLIRTNKSVAQFNKKNRVELLNVESLEILREIVDLAHHHLVKLCNSNQNGVSIQILHWLDLDKKTTEAMRICDDLFLNFYNKKRKSFLIKAYFNYTYFTGISYDYYDYTNKNIFFCIKLCDDIKINETVDDGEYHHDDETKIVMRDRKSVV